MKNTLRFLIVSLCLMFSISAFADRRGADLFKPAGNRTSPAQWTRSNSGNNFSYSRGVPGVYGGQQMPVYGRNASGAFNNTSVNTGGAEMQYATNDFLNGDPAADDRQGQQRVRGFANANPGYAEKGPVGDAIPFVVMLAMAFAAFKFYRSKSRVTE